MNHHDAEKTSQSYEATTWLIKKHADGLTTADSVVQPPFPGNCFNWVLGHILTSRHTVLTLLGADLVWGADEVRRYKTGSLPITDEEQAMSLEKLLADLDSSHNRIVSALAEIEPEQLDRVAETDRGVKPVGQHIDGLHWHETYHTGQLELLRELALANRISEDG